MVRMAFVGTLIRATSGESSQRFLYTDGRVAGSDPVPLSHTASPILILDAEAVRTPRIFKRRSAVSAAISLPAEDRASATDT
jgi:hypothetical protein